ESSWNGRFTTLTTLGGHSAPMCCALRSATTPHIPSIPPHRTARSRLERRSPWSRVDRWRSPPHWPPHPPPSTPRPAPTSTGFAHDSPGGASCSAPTGSTPIARPGVYCTPPATTRWPPPPPAPDRWRDHDVRHRRCPDVPRRRRSRASSPPVGALYTRLVWHCWPCSPTPAATLDATRAGCRRACTPGSRPTGLRGHLEVRWFDAQPP